MEISITKTNIKNDTIEISIIMKYTLTQTKYEYPSNPIFTKFLDNWYFYQTYSNKEYYSNKEHYPNSFKINYK